MGLLMSEKDEIVMSLVHYFITEENYTPIIVKGAKDEIWLENLDGPYRVVRINSNPIHNDEQLNYDILKTKSVLRQIKRKTFSVSMNILNIFLDMDYVPKEDYKHMDLIYIDSLKSVPKNKVLTSAFKKITTNLSTDKIDIQELINKTEDVNRKTEKQNREYENVFKPKKLVITPLIIMLCTILFVFMFINTHFDLSAANLLDYGAVQRDYVQSGDWYRLFTCIFIHASILHLLFNMYALYIIGSQMESYLGKIKYALVFIVSGLVGSLSSIIFSRSVSVGASGAIFGLLGAMLYFAYYYRLILGNSLRHEIIPVIILNLVLGFMIPGVDIFAHIGGLAGGAFAMMALGVPGKTNKKAMINGTICLFMLIAFLTYIAFYRV